MLPVLRIAARGESRVPIAAEAIANEFELSEAEREERLPSNTQRRLHNRMHWAKFYMTKAGLIDSPGRGRFVASEAGRDLLARNPDRIDVEMLRDYPSFREFIDANTGGSGRQETEPERKASITTTPEEQIDDAAAVLHSALRTDLLQRIIASGPMFFERVIVDLLVAMGYGGSHENAAMRLGRSGDGGVDGVIDEDRLGLDRIYVQAKCYRLDASVGRPEVQGFVGSLVGLGATKGVFVTTGRFSGHALDYVRPLVQRIILIDGDRLANLLIEHNVGVRISRTIAVKRLDEDFFEGE